MHCNGLGIVCEYERKKNYGRDEQYNHQALGLNFKLSRVSGDRIHTAKLWRDDFLVNRMVKQRKEP